MPWVIAKLRNQKVYARADEQGALLAKSGRVEIRYRPNDGKLYQAGERNLTVVDPTPLPEATCGAAEAVTRDKADAQAAPNGSGEPGGTASGGSKRPGKARAGRGAGVAALRAPLPGELTVYTDGACSSNPGPAGLGVVVVRPTERVELSEYLGQGTNNIAELTAVLRALEELGEGAAARIHTDSQYSIGVLQKGWKAKANPELVARIREELRRRPNVTLCYVPGHHGVPLNERCDELARLAISSRSSRRLVLPAKATSPRPTPLDPG